MAATSTHKDPVAEGIEALSAQLAAGNSAALTTYLSAMGRFHNYSFGNVLAIAMQRPDAKHVAGFNAWKQMGRFVKKGEKGIHILAPLVGKAKDTEATEDSAARVFGFRGVYVFDISQTDGQPLPEFATASGDAGDALAKLLTFASTRGIAVSFAADLGGAHGVSKGGTIEVLAGLSDAETISVLTHELAHELLHKAERRTTDNRNSRELEAEAVAFIVGSAIGLDMSTASADYIKLYNGNAEMLADSLDAISKASRMILAEVAA